MRLLTYTDCLARTLSRGNPLSSGVTTYSRALSPACVSKIVNNKLYDTGKSELIIADRQEDYGEWQVFEHGICRTKNGTLFAYEFRVENNGREYRNIELLDGNASAIEWLIKEGFDAAKNCLVLQS